jgi:hypothetical protein
MLQISSTPKIQISTKSTKSSNPTIYPKSKIKKSNNPAILQSYNPAIAHLKLKRSLNPKKIPKS